MSNLTVEIFKAKFYTKKKHFIEVSLRGKFSIFNKIYFDDLKDLHSIFKEFDENDIEVISIFGVDNKYKTNSSMIMFDIVELIEKGTKTALIKQAILIRESGEVFIDDLYDAIEYHNNSLYCTTRSKSKMSVKDQYDLVQIGEYLYHE